MLERRTNTLNHEKTKSKGLQYQLALEDTTQDRLPHQSYENESIIPPQANAEDYTRCDTARHGCEGQEGHDTVDDEVCPDIAMSRKDDKLDW